MRLVIIESPFGDDDPLVVEANIKYARAAVRDSLMRGETPFASHLFYTQPGILNDQIPDERARGIAAGLAWAEKAALTAVYVDRGISKGMQQGIQHAELWGRSVEWRKIL